MLRRALLPLAVAVTAVGALAGCSSDDDPAPASTAGCSSDDDPAPASTTGLAQATMTVHYTYVGPSTPPPHHREYVLDVSDGNASARIGGYGTVDGDAEADTTTETDITAQQWETMVAALDSLPEQRTPEDGCAGGTTYSVVVKDAGRTSIDRSDYVCGSDNAATGDAYQAFVAPIAQVLGLP